MGQGLGVRHTAYFMLEEQHPWKLASRMPSVTPLRRPGGPLWARHRGRSRHSHTVNIHQNPACKETWYGTAVRNPECSSVRESGKSRRHASSAALIIKFTSSYATSPVANPQALLPKEEPCLVRRGCKGPRCDCSGILSKRKHRQKH